MGFDIYGKAPRSEAGRYFAANWGGWSELARVCFRVAPGPCSQIEEKYWFSNDGTRPGRCRCHRSGGRAGSCRQHRCRQV